MPDESVTIHFPFPPGNDFQAAVWIRYIFHEIARHHGEPAAQKLFREFGRPLKPTTLRTLRNWRLLSRVDAMTEPNLHALARELVRENKTLPAADRWGSTDKLPSADTLYRQIKALMKRREREIIKGTWRGPGAPVPVITSAAIIVS